MRGKKGIGTSYPESPWKASGSAGLEMTMTECCPILVLSAFVIFGGRNEIYAKFFPCTGKVVAKSAYVDITEVVPVPYESIRYKVVPLFDDVSNIIHGQAARLTNFCLDVAPGIQHFIRRNRNPMEIDANIVFWWHGQYLFDSLNLSACQPDFNNRRHRSPSIGYFPIYAIGLRYWKVVFIGNQEKPRTFCIYKSLSVPRCRIRCLRLKWKTVPHRLRSFSGFLGLPPNQTQGEEPYYYQPPLGPFEGFVPLWRIALGTFSVVADYAIILKGQARWILWFRALVSLGWSRIWLTDHINGKSTEQSGYDDGLFHILSKKHRFGVDLSRAGPVRKHRARH